MILHRNMISNFWQNSTWKHFFVTDTSITQSILFLSSFCSILCLSVSHNHSVCQFHCSCRLLLFNLLSQCVAPNTLTIHAIHDASQEECSSRMLEPKWLRSVITMMGIQSGIFMHFRTAAAKQNLCTFPPSSLKQFRVSTAQPPDGR